MRFGSPRQAPAAEAWFALSRFLSRARALA